MFSFPLLRGSFDRANVWARKQCQQMLLQVQGKHDANERVERNSLAVFHAADGASGNAGGLSQLLLADIFQQANGLELFAQVALQGFAAKLTVCLRHILIRIWFLDHIDHYMAQNWSVGIFWVKYGSKKRFVQ